MHIVDGCASDRITLAMTFAYFCLLQLFGELIESFGIPAGTAFHHFCMTSDERKIIATFPGSFFLSSVRV
jgi:hypothetical protein